MNTYTGNLHSSTLKDMLEEIEKHMDAKYRMVLDEEIEKRMVQVIKLREDVFERWLFIRYYLYPISKNCNKYQWTSLLRERERER